MEKIMSETEIELRKIWNENNIPVEFQGDLLAQIDAKAQTAANIWKCNKWLCSECNKVIEDRDFLDHLRNTHKIDAVHARGTRNEMMHIDGYEYFQTNYRVEIEGLKFIHIVRNVRAADNMMRWFYEEDHE